MFLSAAVAVLLGTASASSLTPEKGVLESTWFTDIFSGMPKGLNPVQARDHILDRVIDLSSQYTADIPAPKSEFPYFNVFPQFRATAVPGAEPVRFLLISICFS